MKDPDYIPKPRKSKAKPNTGVAYEYRLMDPATGLFWGTSSADRPTFNQSGKHWGSAKAAQRNRVDYEAARRIEDDAYPRGLVLVKFKIVRERVGVIDDEMPCVDGLVNLSQYRHQYPESFVRTLAYDDFRFSHVLEFEVDHAEDFIASLPAMKKKTYSIVLRHSWSLSRAPEDKSDTVYVAVLTEKDMMLLTLIETPKRVFTRDGALVKLS